jgi:hypothetical protein
MRSAMVPAGLDANKAVLPVTYERAKVALAECDRVDECQDWANKAEALASYAKQAEDSTMRQFADRIQARAIRRCGELLKTFQSDGGRPAKTTVGTRESFGPRSQREAASEAGLSPHKELQAVRVSNIPEPVFESAVESENPPTVTKLAEMGTARDPLYTGTPASEVTDKDANDAAALHALKRTWRSASKTVKTEFRRWIDARQ